ncbi:hypothetical protein EDD15DRAFT_2196576 [Pisolithus albus]|nr:hypothetical protein EDD15DRAFT_2196576 [Pisolithus albus]
MYNSKNLELPPGAIEEVTGNASRATKELVALWFLYIRDYAGGGFGVRTGKSLKLVEISILPKGDEPKRQEARVVLEMTVTEDMLNLAGKLHGACITYIVDMCAIVSSLVDVGGSGDPGVSQQIDTTFHAPASFCGIPHTIVSSRLERKLKWKHRGLNFEGSGGKVWPTLECKMIQHVETVEKSLLAGRWNSQLDPETHSILQLAKATVDGDFRTVLTSKYAQELFQADPRVSVDRPYSELFSWKLQSVDDERERELIQLILAVACLHTFVQVNWTGPNLNFKLSDIISFPQHQPPISEEALSVKAIAELAHGGEPAYHLAQFPVLFRFAQIILGSPYVHCRYTPWWRLRAAIIHERLLDEAVPMSPEVLDSLAPLVETTTSDPDLAGQLLLEQGLLEHIFSHDKAAAELFVRAARATGLQYELTGALGKRTKFQQNDLSQLVLLAESRNVDNSSDKKNAAKSIDGVATRVPETLSLNDDTLLEQTEFTSTATATGKAALSHLDPSSQPPLQPLDQCILLSLCLNVRNTSPSHGLTAEQMSPYVARVISHPQNWSVHTMALLLRSRLEASRTRTVERSTLQLQALVDQMPTADSELSERLLYFHSVPLPSKWEMERELALRFLSIGVVKSALEIFERLEMWEEVVKCWQSMERNDKAIAIVRDLLEGRKEEADSVLAKAKDLPLSRRVSMDIAREAKLWCLLGDLEPDNAIKHYEHAWKLSMETSGRAMRSLGGYYFSRGKFADAVTCLRRAVAINPLIARSWFVLGCAYVRMENWEGGRDAFSRCVAIDDEDAESWNNLATMYLRLDAAKKSPQDGGIDKDGDRSDDAVTFSNKMLAFRALKRGLKYSYDNWRMWSNYMIVAIDVGELSEACRAQARIVEERADKMGVECVDDEVLERLVDAVTRRQGDDPDQPTMEDKQGTVTGAVPSEDHGLVRRVVDLFERTILPRVSSSRIFRTYARLLTWQSRWEDALNAHLNAYRCGPAGTFEKGETEVEKWREAVNEVGEIEDILANFGPRVEGFDWKHQGRSILRTFIGRSKDFEDEPEWPRLTEMLDWLRSGE